MFSVRYQHVLEIQSIKMNEISPLSYLEDSLIHTSLSHTNEHIQKVSSTNFSLAHWNLANT